LIKAEQAHKMLGSNASTVVVAVVDTGVDLGHPALKERLLPGRNIVNKNNDPRNQTPNEMHGTHVSGSIIMDPEYSGGSFGVAYPVAKVMPVRVLDQSGRGSYGNIAKGIVWASDNGAQVINMSLGGPFRNKLLHDSIRYAVNSRGIVVVAAKGNSNSSRRFYPAAYPEVMAVTATDKNDNRASFSNYGNDSSASAPGHEIYSSVPGGGFRIASGTSMASPHVSASVALIISKNRDINPQQVRAIIENNGDEIKTDKPVGRRINLVNFLGATNTIPN
jgi:thermitase